MGRLWELHGRTEDDDVAHERRKVAAITEQGLDTGALAQREQPVVVINELHKRYVSREGHSLFRRSGRICGRGHPGHVAVRNLSLQIPSGQCFGFLASTVREDNNTVHIDWRK